MQRSFDHYRSGNAKPILVGWAEYLRTISGSKILEGFLASRSFRLYLATKDIDWLLFNGFSDIEQLFMTIPTHRIFVSFFQMDFLIWTSPSPYMWCLPKERDQVSPLSMTSGPSQDALKTVSYPNIFGTSGGASTCWPVHCDGHHHHC